MPYSVSSDAKGCSGFAVVKDGTNEPIPGGCHKTRSEAVKHLVALRLSYEGRYNPDQPRDPDGKFGSGGGGASPSSSGGGGGGGSAPAPVKTKYKAGDKAGSKAKTAPKNVTSKGVNPNSEYVLSEKTGNFFKNPNYNGNPDGAGKFSPAGKNKGKQGSIDDLEGGAKFKATGQAKYKEGTPSAPKPSSPKPSTYSPSPRPSGVKADKISGKPAPSKTEQDDFKVKTDKQVESLKGEISKKGSERVHDEINGVDGSNEGNLGKLTASERMAIRGYTGMEYEEMNKELRDSHGKITSHKNRYAQEGLEKTSLQRDVVLSRGVAVGPGSGLFALEPGDEIYDPGFISTSTKNTFGSAQVQLRIQAPKGTKGMSVKEISQWSSEDEVLLPAGLTLRVMNKAEELSGKVTYDCEIVSQGIRPGVEITRSLRAKANRPDDDYFSAPADSLAINGVFPDGFTLSE